VYGGTGLGLPITAKLIQKMGGNISVQSSIGNWTEFTADFPYEAAEARFTEQIPRLANTAVIVVVARPTTDCPVIGWLRQIGVTAKLIPSCNDLEATAQEVEARGLAEYYIPLVHDEGFLPEVYDRFAKNRKCQLMTFGYKNDVDCAVAHVHSPCRVFPSLFLPILGDLVERSKTSKVVRIESTLDSSILIIRNQEPPKKVVPSSPNSSHRHAYSDIRVLIAEDNRVNQRVLTKTLNRLGLEQIDVVDNGQKAVEAASKKVYDVIFMDMEMPVMNGLDACREITKNKLRLLPIVVFVTAHAIESFRKEAGNAGGYSFISKPFNLQKIDDLLRAIPWDKLTETEYRTQAASCQTIVSPIAGN
jgi:CheY-like chemotaxis protein